MWSNQRSIRAIAVGAIAVTIAYLIWRGLFTLAGATWWLAGPLFLAEVHSFITFLGFTFVLWDVQPPLVQETTSTELKVDVLIPTYNEPWEVLLPVISAAVDLRLARKTIVLDDGDRETVRAMAAQLGAEYQTRAEHEHAKAGNLNAHLLNSDADLVLVLDADHVVSPQFLQRTLAYFDDPKVAVVQTPQDFYNDDSFEYERMHKGHFAEQELFYRVMSPGRNRWNAAFWCGTGALLRVAALRSIGLVATDSITEDILTTIRLHKRGWKTVQHNEVLARGLAASTSDQYLVQRNRWCVGAMQVLRREPVLGARELTKAQKLSYLATLTGWFDSWRTLIYLLLPVVTLLTGGTPVDAPIAQFLPLFVATFVIQRIALSALSRGKAPQWYATVFDIVKLASIFPATLTIFSNHDRKFQVTTKGQQGNGRLRQAVPTMHQALLAASATGLVWFTLAVTGIVPWRYPNLGLAYTAAFWTIVNVVFLLASMARIRSLRFGGERRAAYRFMQSAPSVLHGPIEILDLSVTGARVWTSQPTCLGETMTLRLDGTDGPFEVKGEIVRADASGAHLRFDESQQLSLAQIAHIIFSQLDGVTRVFPESTLEAAS